MKRYKPLTTYMSTYSLMPLSIFRHLTATRVFPLAVCCVVQFFWWLTFVAAFFDHLNNFFSHLLYSLSLYFTKRHTIFSPFLNISFFYRKESDSLVNIYSQSIHFALICRKAIQNSRKQNVSNCIGSNRIDSHSKGT